MVGFDQKQVRKVLQIPDKEVVVLIITIGKGKQTACSHADTGRQSVSLLSMSSKHYG